MIGNRCFEMGAASESLEGEWILEITNQHEKEKVSVIMETVLSSR